MPFCSQCGHEVGAANAFCGKCGKPQPLTAPVPPVTTDPLAGVNPRTAAILCYVPGLGWIAAIVVLASERFRHDRPIRFHAFQGLYLFVAWLMADWVFRPMVSFMLPQLHIYQLVQAVLLVASIFMMIKAAHNREYSLPLFGELAQRSMTEE